MLMRYFTLSSLCVLIFCMLIALSGTTDLPYDYSENLMSSGHAPGTIQKNVTVVKDKQDNHSPMDSAKLSSAELTKRRGLEKLQKKQLYFHCIISMLGIFIFVLWLFLSIKLLTVGFPKKING